MVIINTHWLQTQLILSSNLGTATKKRKYIHHVHVKFKNPRKEIICSMQNLKKVLWFYFVIILFYII